MILWHVPIRHRSLSQTAPLFSTTCIIIRLCWTSFLSSTNYLYLINSLKPSTMNIKSLLCKSNSKSHDSDWNLLVPDLNDDWGDVFRVPDTQGELGCRWLVHRHFLRAIGPRTRLLCGVCVEMEASWSDVHVCCVYSFKSYDSVSNPDNSRLFLVWYGTEIMVAQWQGPPQYHGMTNWQL